MTTAPKKPRSYLNWVTIGVTTLPPGWVNVYRDEAGSDDVGKWTTEPTPALLLEEATTQTWMRQEERGGRIVASHDRTEALEVRQTRVIYASTDGGELVAANDCMTYVYSTTMDDFALHKLEYETTRGQIQASQRAESA